MRPLSQASHTIAESFIPNSYGYSTNVAQPITRMSDSTAPQVYHKTKTNKQRSSCPINTGQAKDVHVGLKDKANKKHRARKQKGGNVFSFLSDRTDERPSRRNRPNLQPPQLIILPPPPHLQPAKSPLKPHVIHLQRHCASGVPQAEPARVLAWTRLQLACEQH